MAIEVKGSNFCSGAVFGSRLLLVFKIEFMASQLFIFPWFAWTWVVCKLLPSNILVHTSYLLYIHKMNVLAFICQFFLFPIDVTFTFTLLSNRILNFVLLEEGYTSPLILQYVIPCFAWSMTRRVWSATPQWKQNKWWFEQNMISAAIVIFVWLDILYKDKN